MSSLSVYFKKESFVCDSTPTVLLHTWKVFLPTEIVCVGLSCISHTCVLNTQCHKNFGTECVPDIHIWVHNISISILEYKWGDYKCVQEWQMPPVAANAFQNIGTYYCIDFHKHWYYQEYILLILHGVLLHCHLFSTLSLHTKYLINNPFPSSG